MRCLKEGLKFQAQAIKAGFKLSIVSCNQLIHLYSKNGFVEEAHKLFDEMLERNVFSWNAIIWAHIKSRNLAQARVLFDAAPLKDSVTYNSMLSGYANSDDGCETLAIDLFAEMRAGYNKAPCDEFSFTTLLNLTAKMNALSYGRQLHCLMLKSANDLSGFAVSVLVDMYSKCGCLQDAWGVFDGNEARGIYLVSKNAMIAACCREGAMQMAQDLFLFAPEFNDTVSWNTLISGYVQNGYVGEAIRLFKCMVQDGIQLNEHTFASVLSACSSLKSFKIGMEIHAWVLKEGLMVNAHITSGLVDVYCKSGNLKYAESILSTTAAENSFSITSMIMGYSSIGKMVEARRLFNLLAEKNSVVWTAMFSGYLKSQQCKDVFMLFSEFQKNETTAPDALILVNMLGACAIQAAIDPGMQLHAYILRTGIEMDDKIISGMVDMYSKCGNITYAQNIFLRVINRDAVLYNIMIAGYAHHGHEYDAVRLYEEMIEKAVRPNAVTFVAILSACRHCGLVEKGEKYFFSMTKDYAILPETDHYACMIDLYGRANQLEKAVAFMRKIPIEPDAVILGAFLNACRMNRNVELAREAEEKILRIEGGSGARYVQLANAYSSEGKWDETSRIRKKMRGNEVKKLAGCSWLYAGNGVHVFTSCDRSHSQAEAIYSLLGCLYLELSDATKIIYD